ncbi:MAG TPA: LysR family transcriptional regulator [Clostridiales bacterium]|nr:LysR family transcriptional regulator [Clostridiales bacterium]
MDVNFELYKVFYYVAKYLSFSAAASALYISQSAVSQSIKLLEKQLNSTLFFRHTKLVQLTPEGKLLFQHIEQAFHLIKAGEKSIQEIHSLQKGEVKIGASDTICKYYLLPYLKAFHQMYPDIQIRITNRPSPVCVELLKKGAVDISVVNLLPNALYEKIQVKEMKKIQDVLIAGKPFEHLRHHPISIRELEKYPLLLLEKNSTTRRIFEDFAQQHGATIAPEFELGSMDLLIQLTRIGLGISFVMLDAIEKELLNQEIFILKIKEELPQRSIGVLTNSTVPLSIAAQKFIELF